jgi:hypothetical protein
MHTLSILGLVIALFFPETMSKEFLYFFPRLVAATWPVGTLLILYGFRSMEEKRE